MTASFHSQSNASFSYSTHFTLDRAYYAECFDASVTQPAPRAEYTKALGFLLIGLALLLTGVNAYASWFIIALGVLEGLSIKFKRPWYLTRQMMSKAAGNEANLTLNEQGISIESLYVKQQLSWDGIDDIQETSAGFLLLAGGQKHYLSKRFLDEACCQFIRGKGAKQG
ncbi:YcxB family protein [Shewanella alkalitolerans]|uniref:YcxB family protein n=1 Tax=Shewanella alkalitolerans TaxID=2864209 RepID=UPI001C660F0B|nr:YcxB family protein [Shewanella alkalitolerans]QYJ98530.1 YcxB family protein [Shewanella alkalitolerans]